MVGGECVNLGRLYSYDVMVVFFSPNAHPKLIQSLNLQGGGIDTIGQTYMVVFEVVVAKGTSTLFEVVSGFWRNHFACLCPFLRGCVHAKL